MIWMNVDNQIYMFQKYINIMSHQFFDFQALEEGTKKIVTLIQKMYPTEALDYDVLPNVQPGFLKSKLDERPPEEGCDLQTLIKQTQEIIHPGIMHWQSPKFFGYFPTTISVTTAMAQLYASVYHTPGFTYSASPSQTELQNVVVEWVGTALGLPQQFSFKNSGGAVINPSASESILVSVHAGKRRKMNEINIMQNPERIVKLVGYFSEFGVAMNEKALRLKEIFHVRKVPAHFSKEKQNFEVNATEFREMVQKDVEEGLIPFWYGSTFGTTYSNATDVCPQVLAVCKEFGMWVHVDAAYLGTTLLCPQLRPDMKVFSQVDSFSVNFSKTLFVGIYGNVFFVKNRHEFTSTFQSDISFTFTKNKLSEQKKVVDYKDWGFGFARRFNSLKFFYLFRFYGLAKLQNFIKEFISKREHATCILQKKQIFEIFSKPQFGLVCFRLKDSSGQPNNKLTKILGERIRNIKEGFMSPGDFHEYTLLRLSIGSTNTLQSIQRYLQKIYEVGRQILAQNKTEE